MIARGKRRATARRVAPGSKELVEQSTESAKYQRWLFRSFRASRFTLVLSRDDALRACPWLSYFAPLALGPWLFYFAPLALGPWLFYLAPLALGPWLFYFAPLALGPWLFYFAPLALGPWL